MTKGLACLWVSASLLLAPMACSSTSDPPTITPCADREEKACTCAGGVEGISQCVNGAFQACSCGASSDGGVDATAGEGGTPDGGGGGDGGKPTTSDAGFGQYMGPCNDTPDCPPAHQCFQFGSKGKACTKSCTVNTDCPAPSPKCNPRQICALPD